jgi:FdhE protein
MKEAMSPEAAAERIRNALDLMKKNGSHLENILNAFSGLLIEQARLKAELSSDNIFVKKDEYERERLGKGAPLTSREKLIGIGNMWKVGIERLMPPMMTGFPNIAKQLEKLKSSITSEKFDLDLYAAEVLEEVNPNTLETASDSAVDRGIVKFVLIHISKPFVEKRAETFKPFTDGLFWERGYCPICGSLPELSILREKEGRRWLRCGFCRHEWPFMRTACPCCETQESGNAENLFIDGREHERLELCLHCRKYVAEIDIRAAIEEPVLEIVGIGLLHLDVLARKRGFRSMGGSWGSVM